MKTLITYYSYSGNTDKAARIFARVLKAKGEVDIRRLKPKDEIRSFLGQCKAAFTRKRANLEEGAIFDLNDYDLILIGSPVWAFAPTPAMNTFLDRLSGLTGKPALVFLTSGSGVGVKRCFDNIKTVLRSKGASEVYEVNIPARKIGDEDFITSLIKKFVL